MSSEGVHYSSGSTEIVQCLWRLIRCFNDELTHLSKSTSNSIVFIRSEVVHILKQSLCSMRQLFLHVLSLPVREQQMIIKDISTSFILVPVDLLWSRIVTEDADFSCTGHRKSSKLLQFNVNDLLVESLGDFVWRTRVVFNFIDQNICNVFSARVCFIKLQFSGLGVRNPYGKLPSLSRVLCGNQPASFAQRVLSAPLESFLLLLCCFLFEDNGSVKTPNNLPNLYSPSHNFLLYCCCHLLDCLIFALFPVIKTTDFFLRSCSFMMPLSTQSPLFRSSSHLRLNFGSKYWIIDSCVAGDHRQFLHISFKLNWLQLQKDLIHLSPISYSNAPQATHHLEIPITRANLNSMVAVRHYTSDSSYNSAVYSPRVVNFASGPISDYYHYHHYYLRCIPLTQLARLITLIECPLDFPTLSISRLVQKWIDFVRFRLADVRTSANTLPKLQPTVLLRSSSAPLRKKRKSTEDDDVIVPNKQRHLNPSSSVLTKPLNQQPHDNPF